jgi:hypothetical protein
MFAILALLFLYFITVEGDYTCSDAFAMCAVFSIIGFVVHFVSEDSPVPETPKTKLEKREILAEIFGR